jgi:hypothetical protein
MAGHESRLLALGDEKLSFVVYFAVLRSAHDVLDVHQILLLQLVDTSFHLHIVALRLVVHAGVVHLDGLLDLEISSSAVKSDILVNIQIAG